MVNLILNSSDKRGIGEDLMSVWWILALVLVGVAVTVGIIFFYSSDFDIRGMETLSLSEQVKNCLIINSFLSPEAIDKNFDVFEKCGFNKKVFDDELFYIQIEFLDVNGRPMRDMIDLGSAKFLNWCSIQKDSSGETVKAEHYPICFESEAIFLYPDSSSKGEIKEGKLRMITASQNLGERLPGK